MDRRLQGIARRYIRRLALQPYLGRRVPRGRLADHGCRRIYFDRDDNPDDLFGAHRQPLRRGDQDPSEGPGWRIVYWLHPMANIDLRVVVVLAVAPGHGTPSQTAYALAARRLDPYLKALRQKGAR